MVRHETLTLTCEGSIPSFPANIEMSTSGKSPVSETG